MKLPATILCMLVLAPLGFAADKNTPPAKPIAWGMLSGNTGCVIFKQGRKTSGMFWGVAVTTKTVGKLTVVETQNYTMDEHEILETQENMDALTLRAQKDHLKFVKIPDKFSPDELQKARTLCKQDQTQ